MGRVKSQEVSALGLSLQDPFMSDTPGSALEVLEAITPWQINTSLAGLINKSCPTRSGTVTINSELDLDSDGQPCSVTGLGNLKHCQSHASANRTITLLYIMLYNSTCRS
jgi:hypothetical protein